MHFCLQIRLLKPKAATEKNHLWKTNSSVSSVEEEPVSPELIVPHKGKELPRTPPLKPGSETGVDRPDFLVPTIAPPPIAGNLKTYTNSAKIGKQLSHKKNCLCSWTTLIAHH